MTLRFDEKAQENLEAAAHLLEHGQGGFLNAAASRAYYAAYLAVADAAQRQNRPFDGARDYYKHDNVPDNAYRWQIVDDDEPEALILLRDDRIKADYYEEPIELEEAELLLEHATHLVRKILRGNDVDT